MWTHRHLLGIEDLSGAGPVNRGVELDPYVADGDRSVILDQVEAGVAVRMAVLELILGGQG